MAKREKGAQKRGGSTTAAFLLTFFAAVLAGAGAHALDNILLWDAEAPFQCTSGERYPADETNDPPQSYGGKYCFKGIHDGYHKLVVKLYGLQTHKTDLTLYDELWMFVKAETDMRAFTFAAVQYPSNAYSNTVDLNTVPELVAKPTGARELFGTDYRLVRVRIADLVNANCPLTQVDRFVFGAPDTSYKGVNYIDDIWAVKLDPAHASSPGRYLYPVVGAMPAVTLPDTAVARSSQREVIVPNLGNSQLNVTNITFEGANPSEFSASPQAFSVAPGATGKFVVTFAAQSPGEKSATAILTHNTSFSGTSSYVHVSARAMGPTIDVSAEKLDFGTTSAGIGASWPLTICNTGNMPLNVSTNFSAAGTPFTASPTTLAVSPGSSSTLIVNFNSRQTGTFTDKLTLTSNDHNHPSTPVTVRGAVTSSGAKTIPVVVGTVTARKVNLTWPRVDGAQKVQVYIGPEPPTTAEGALPVQKSVLTLSGTSTGCTIKNLAAAVDVFIHVESQQSDGTPIAGGNAYARTLGGPMAELDLTSNDGDATDKPTHVREVHMMAPNILMVIISEPGVTSFTGATGELIGYNGPEWQAGPWTVTRRDDKTIPVLSVYRHSVPVGQFDIRREYTPDGQLGTDNLKKVDVDHRIYLALNEPVGNRDVLFVQGPPSQSCSFYLPFSDKYLETPVIQVNQVGYSPTATRRYAYVSGWLGDGGPLSLGSFKTASVIAEPEYPMEPRKTIVPTIDINVRSTNDSDAGAEVRDIDLSSVPPAEGQVYRVQVPGVGVSWQTQVSHTATFKAFYVIMRGLYYNRWGRDLRPECTELGPRPPDHPTVYTGEMYDAEGYPDSGDEHLFPPTTPMTGERPLTGGHHDAGDFDQQEDHLLVGIILSRPLEINPQAFPDGQLTIPESGNGIPDILDEILYEVRAWEQLQEADGGIRGGVESSAHPVVYLYADEDKSPYWTYSRDPWHTVRMAGLFASTSRLVRPYDAARADELQERAIRAYDYAVTHGVDTTHYRSLLYGAGELYRLTGNTRYSNDFEAACDYMSKASGYSNYVYLSGRYPLSSEVIAAAPTMPVFPDLYLGYLQSPGVATKWYYSTATSRIAQAAALVSDELEKGHAHRSARGAVAPGWGMSVAMGMFTPAALAQLQLGDQVGLTAPARQDLLNQISLCVDNFLGCNPNGMVWVTRLGSRYPTNPLHADALALWADKRELMPGITVFGPITNLSPKSYYDYGRKVYYPAFQNQPLLRRYGDLHSFVTTNEGGPFYNAVHAQLLGALLPPGLKPPQSWLPNGNDSLNPLPPREGIVPAAAGDDKTAPVMGTVTAPQLTNKSPIRVSFAGAADTGSGIKQVKLWVKKGKSGTWQETGLAAASASGSFDYAGMAGDDVYYFAAQAEDNAGNVSAPPSGTGSASVIYDTNPPIPGSATVAAASRSLPLSVSYSGAQDALSGVKEVRLWVKGPSGVWRYTGLNSTAASGTFSYSPNTGEAVYTFFTQAVDHAGNASSAPTDALVGTS